MCAKSATRDAATSDRALLWVIEGAVVRGLRGVLQPQRLTRSAVLDELVPLCLMHMKLSLYFVSKFKFQKDASKQYPDKLAPDEVLMTIFQSPFVFHRYFSAGTTVEVVIKEAVFESPVLLPTYPAPLREIVEFMRDFMDERDDLREVALRFLATNPSATAESLLDSPAIKDCGLDLGDSPAHSRKQLSDGSMEIYDTEFCQFGTPWMKATTTLAYDNKKFN